MDSTPIVAVIVVLIAAFGVGRALTTLGHASDVMASLFVPPDRRLGWPHGVQEQDAPWAWRPPVAADEDDPPGPVATQPIRGPVIHGGHAIQP